MIATLLVSRGEQISTDIESFLCNQDRQALYRVRDYRLRIIQGMVTQLREKGFPEYIITLIKQVALPDFHIRHLVELNNLDELLED